MVPQDTQYVGNGASVATELSNKEMFEEIGISLNQDGQLTKEELRIGIIEGAMPVMVTDLGASTICIQPAEEHGQTSACGRYKWDTPFVWTGGEGL